MSGRDLMRTLLLNVVLLSAVVCGCAKSDSRDAELVYLQSIMPEALLANAHLDVSSADSVAVIEEGQSKHLGLHLFSGQRKVHGGIRAEVSVDYPFVQGETIRYSWRFKIPKDFVCDAPQNRWWLIGQWHDQPNPVEGETWETFESRSPPVLLGLGELEGQPAISLTYGPTLEKGKSRSIGHVFLERGKWHNLTVVIRWSQQPDGQALVFLDDPSHPCLSAAGPNMNNNYQHYLKLGMYRHPEIDTDNWIYIDDLEITRVSATEWLGTEYNAQHH